MTVAGPIPRGLHARTADTARVLAPFNVEVSCRFAKVLDLWSGMADGDAALPFQSREWLETWEATFGREPGTEIVAATVYDSRWTPVMGLPLVRRRVGASRVIGFADGGVADYNAPVLSPFAPTDWANARALWRALRRALPRGDVIRLERMPTTIGGQTNPLALLSGVRPATSLGLALTMPGTYADWRGALPRRYRMELGRCARLFDALPGAAFRRVDGGDETILTALERLQRERIGTLGLPYMLDGAAFRAFYRDLAGRPGAVLTALTIADDVVAVMLGLRQGRRFVMLRIGAAGGDHTRLSPARHLITRTMEMLRPEGVDCFDFGLGDYAYKRKLGGTPVPLCDLVAARSPLGLPGVAGFHLRSHARTMPVLRTLAARLRLTAAETADRGL